MSWAAHSGYQAELGAPIECGFRRPSGPPVLSIVRPGSIVATSYNSGPYTVVAVTGPHFEDCSGSDFPHWSLSLVDGRRSDGTLPAAHAWINEIVPVDGRLLKLFENNDDEVFVRGVDQRVVDRLFSETAQLDLFSGAA